MKALQIDNYGEPLKVSEAEVPSISDNQLLIHICAASVNPVDYRVKSGAAKHVLRYKMPLTLGHDFSGVVAKVGNKVQNYKAGDFVFGRAPVTGSFCDYYPVEENDLYFVPENVSLKAAAAVPLVALTAYQGLFEGLDLKSGQTLLVTGGSGGVGSYVIALAKRIGAKVITTASPEGIEFLKDYHVDQFIDYKKDKFVDILSNVDAVFDTRGRQDLIDAFSVVKNGGKVVSIASLPTSDYAKKAGLPFIAAPLLKFANRKLNKLAKQKNVRYYALLTQSNARQLADIRQAIEEGDIPIKVERYFDYTEAQKAIETMERGKVKGKLVIVLNKGLDPGADTDNQNS